MIKFKTKLFFLPLEIKTREFYPKLYFANMAIENNYSCFLGDKAGIFRATKYFNNGVYFYKSINFTDTNHILKIKKNNNKYIVQDEEGGFSFSNKREFSKFFTFRSSKKNVQLIDRFFNWGIFDYKNCSNRYLEFKKKFVIAGGLRFEVCNKKIFNKIYSTEINKIKECYSKKYILITTSHLTSKKEIKNYINSDASFMKLYTNKQKKLRLKNLKGFLEMNYKFRDLIIYLNKHFPKITIVIRPHPSENLDDWRKFLNDKLFNKKNIFINTESDINALTKQALCLINSKSSSALHAFFHKIPIISFIPGDLKYKKRIFDYMGTEAKNKNSVKNLVKKILTHKDLKGSRKVNKMLTLHINNLRKNKNITSKIILNEVEKIYSGISEINIFKILLLSPIYKISDFFFKVFKIRYYNPKLFQSAIRSTDEKILNGLNKKEIEEFFINIGKINQVRIYEFGKNCFFICKKKI